jgi:hypothetical protein
MMVRIVIRYVKRGLQHFCFCLLSYDVYNEWNEDGILEKYIYLPVCCISTHLSLSSVVTHILLSWIECFYRKIFFFRLLLAVCVLNCSVWTVCPLMQHDICLYMRLCVYFARYKVRYCSETGCLFRGNVTSHGEVIYAEYCFYVHAHMCICYYTNKH